MLLQALQKRLFGVCCRCRHLGNDLRLLEESSRRKNARAQRFGRVANEIPQLFVEFQDGRIRRRSDAERLVDDLADQSAESPFGDVEGGSIRGILGVEVKILQNVGATRDVGWNKR